MDQSDLILLFGYNRWANAKVLAACEEATEELLFAPAAVSFGSVMGTLAHILGAEITWRMRLQDGVSVGKMVTEKNFPSLEALAARWTEEEAKMGRFIESLREEDLGRWVEYTRLSGKQESSTLWKALVHVIHHGTQFRGEVGAALGGMGHSPGNLDFIQYLRESEQR